ncbi:hypothetical protein N9R28_00695 [Flavobacteriaceae bacterium]|nr:hypothetical protein [Flavobacteriaceae bacterium]
MKILCLTGTSHYQFNRLVKSVDVTLGPKYSVIIQLGGTNYKVKYSESFNFCKKNELIKLIIKADIIITQGGYGSMMDSLLLNKKVIAVPRKLELNETLHDQTEHVEYLSKKGFLIGCYNIDNLSSLVIKLLSNEVSLSSFKPESELKIKTIVEDFIDRKIKL